MELRAYGAEVVFCEDTSDDRERTAKMLQRKYGYAMVPPFDDDKIIAGQGTVMLEVAQELDSHRLSIYSIWRRWSY